MRVRRIGGRVAARDLVREAVEIGLAADELLVLLRVATAEGNAEPVGELVVEVQEARVRLGVHVVLVVIDVEQALERHEVMDEAALLEVVEAGDIVEPAVERSAEQLELLGKLVLVLVVGDFLDLFGRAVEIDADAPLDLAVASDGLERDLSVTSQSRVSPCPTGRSLRSSHRWRMSYRCCRCRWPQSSSRCAGRRSEAGAACPDRRHNQRRPERHHRRHPAPVTPLRAGPQTPVVVLKMGGNTVFRTAAGVLMQRL